MVSLGNNTFFCLICKHPDEFFHSLRGDVLDHDDAGVVDGDVLGVDDVDGDVRPGVAVQAGGGIHLQGGAHDQEDVRPGHQVDGFLDVRDGLAEKDDVRAQLGPVGGRIAQDDLVIADVDDLVRAVVAVVVAVLRADFGQFPVQVEHPRGAGALVEVIDVLRDYVHVIVLLQTRDGDVRRIGFGILELLPALVVEIQHQLPVPVPPSPANSG